MSEMAGGRGGDRPGPDDVRRLLRPELRSLEPYAAIESPGQVAARYGLDPERLVKLDGNENPEGPSPGALRALAGVAAHRYPDPEQRRLREALGRHLEVPPRSIVAGAGSDELIDLVIRSVAGPGDRVVIAPPTFGMYAFDSGQVGAEVVEVPRRADFTLDGEALVAAARRARLVALASPNNPTGDVAPRALIESLLASGALLLLDEAYIEFTAESSMAQRAASGAPLVVLRTFSKWGGLAGLRVGYAAMPPRLAETLMVAKQPYSVSVAAEAAALASLEERALLDRRACELISERDRMARALQETGWLRPHPSSANFTLVEVTATPAGGAPPAAAGSRLYEALRRRGVLVRHFGGTRLERCVRISAGRPEETDALLGAIAEVAASGEMGRTEG